MRQVYRIELRSVPMATVGVNEIPRAAMQKRGKLATDDDGVEFYPLRMVQFESPEDVGPPCEHLGSSVVEDQGHVIEMERGPQLIEGGPRRSSRRTAGQHSNPCRLPRSVVEEA